MTGGTKTYIGNSLEARGIDDEGMRIVTDVLRNCMHLKELKCVRRGDVVE